MNSRLTLAISALLWLLPVSPGATAQPYPQSQVITGVQYDLGSHQRLAPGSDNWPITWGDDGHQYTSFGDGGGFGGTNSDGRVSLGVARVEGGASSYTGHNVWGGKSPETAASFGGKSYGILSVGGTLYLWVAPGSNTQNFSQQTLYASTDHGHTWSSAGWSFTQAESLVLPTFLQFGQGYAGARDNYVYIYAIRLHDGSALKVQTPGQIDLLRVDRTQILQRTAYEFFAGLNGQGQPTWTADIGARQPVFEDSNGVGWNASVSYNAPLGRYLLCTEHSASFEGNLGMFDAPEPWGPWTTVSYDANWQGFGSTFFWNFSNKWLSPDGHDFVLVFTGTDTSGGNDSWNTVEGSFTAVAPPQPDAGVDAGAAADAGGWRPDAAQAPDAQGPDAATTDGALPDGSPTPDAAEPGLTTTGGCSCHQEGRSPIAPPLLTVLALLTFGWARRRTSPPAQAHASPQAPGLLGSPSRGGAPEPHRWKG